MISRTRIPSEKYFEGIFFIRGSCTLYKEIVNDQNEFRNANPWELTINLHSQFVFASVNAGVILKYVEELNYE
jgi:hypothetical protein